jgi:hypothetical protein
VAAGNIPLAAIAWDAADDPEVAGAIKDSRLLAQAGRYETQELAVRVLDSVIQVMGGASDAYRSCLHALAELDAFDGGWIAEWGAPCVGVAAELVGDRPIAVALALRWVRFCRRSGMRMWLTSGIRSAARVSATAGHHEEGLRLWRGAEHVEALTGMHYLPLMEKLDRPLRQQCIDAVGADAARLLAEGASWSVAEASQAAEEELVRLLADNGSET